MKLDAKVIGRQIRMHRKLQKKSQEALAELIDMSTRTISNIETGTVIPNLQTVASIAECLDCSVDELISKK